MITQSHQKKDKITKKKDKMNNQFKTLFIITKEVIMSEMNKILMTATLTDKSSTMEDTMLFTLEIITNTEMMFLKIQELL
jgi:hypothetical protein